MAALLIFFLLLFLLGTLIAIAWLGTRGWRQPKSSVIAKAALAILLPSGALVGFELLRSLNAEAFNLKLQQKVERNQLIGKAEGNVVAVLGRPSNRIVYKDGGFTLNYFPGVVLPFKKFQAHFQLEGTLRSIELMDD